MAGGLTKNSLWSAISQFGPTLLMIAMGAGMIQERLDSVRSTVNSTSQEQIVILGELRAEIHESTVRLNRLELEVANFRADFAARLAALERRAAEEAPLHQRRLEDLMERVAVLQAKLQHVESAQSRRITSSARGSGSSAAPSTTTIVNAGNVSGEVRHQPK